MKFGKAVLFLPSIPFLTVVGFTVRTPYNYLVRPLFPFMTVFSCRTVRFYLWNIKAVCETANVALYRLVALYSAGLPLSYIVNVMLLVVLETSWWVITGCLVTFLPSILVIYRLKGAKFVRKSLVFLVLKAVVAVRGFVRSVTPTLWP